jgi:tRNA(Ile)-lysidine synthase
MASILKEEEALLEELTKEKATKAVVEVNRQPFLKRSTLSSLPLALQRRVVREFLLRLKGDLRDISFRDVESVLSLDKEKEFKLKKNLILKREADMVSLKKRDPPEIEFEHRWRETDSLEIEEVGLIFKGKRMKREKPRRLDFDDSKVAFLDRAKLRFPLVVRNRRQGDRYQPLGAPGKKKLKEIMRAKGIPVSERGRRPVFLSGEEIAWVLGLPVSEKFKVVPKTKEIFVIEKS